MPNNREEIIKKLKELKSQALEKMPDIETLEKKAYIGFNNVQEYLKGVYYSLPDKEEIKEASSRVVEEVKTNIPSKDEVKKFLNEGRKKSATAINDLKNKLNINKGNMPILDYCGNTSNHKMFFLIDEVPEYIYPYLDGKKEKKYMCLCLECSKGLILGESELNNNVIVFEEALRNEETIAICRQLYLYYSSIGYSNETIIEKINTAIKDNLSIHL